MRSCSTRNKVNVQTGLAQGFSMWSGLDRSISSVKALQNRYRTGLDLCQTGPDSETVPQTGTDTKNRPRHSGLHDPIWTGPETQNPQTGLTMH